MAMPAEVVKKPKRKAAKFIFDDIDVSQKPLFNVTEMGKVFFGRSSHWVRLNEREGKFVLDGEPVGRRRNPDGSRYYTLADVEKIAHALASKGTIDGVKLAYVLRHLTSAALIYDYKIEDPEAAWVYQPIIKDQIQLDYTTTYKDRGHWRWRRHSPEGDVLETSRRTYKSGKAAEAAAARLFNDMR